MKKLHNIIRYALIGVIVTSLGFLAWWYFFLGNEKVALEEIERGRGLGIEVPEFSSPTGNTYLNLTRSISSVPLWSEAKNIAESVVDLLTDKNPGPDSGAAGHATLWHASELPVAGMVFVKQSSVLRFVERATGHILEADMVEKSVSRITNTTIPRVEEAYFSSDGRVFLRTNERGVETTYTGRVDSASSTSLSQRKSLRDHITSFAVHPKNQGITYILKGTESGAVGISALIDDTKQREMVVFKNKDWDVRSFARGRTLYVERPADDVSGYALELTQTGLSPILRNIPGLTVQTNASSTSMLYGTSENGTLSLFIKSDINSSPIKLPLHTIADKCVFSTQGKTAYCAQPTSPTGGEFLNRWYRGEIHTSDSWWKIDTSLGVAELVFDPETEGGDSLDVEMPIMNESGTHIAFRDARDWSLWILSLP